jgi:recombination protein RecA
MMQQARLMSQAMRKLVSFVHSSKVLLIFLNQERATVAKMPGSPTKVQPGGNALKFAASIRAHLARIQSLKKGEEAIGNCVQIKFVKNKVAPPFKVATFDIMFAGYINKEGSLIEEAEKIKVVKKSGSWFLYGETQLGQGLDKSSEYLAQDEKMKNEIYEKVMAYYKDKAAKGAVALERRRAAAPVQDEPKEDSNEDQKSQDPELQED